MIIRNKPLYYRIIALLLGLYIFPTYAQIPQEIAHIKHWRAYVAGRGVTKICYIVSQPIKKHPPTANRGDIFISVTHRPGQATRNEVSLRIGYPFSKKSHPYARIALQEFSFFTGAMMGQSSNSWAWLEHASHHDRMIQAMKQGSKLIFKGRSARGTLTTDTYSLFGFTAALKKIDHACSQ